MNDPIKEDPSEKPTPPAKDPEIRKAPLEDPPAKEPLIDPPAHPHVPGDPEPKIEEPESPQVMQEPKDPAIFV